ncbi:MAG: PaaI family thioesterase [Pseudomonadota bacterium]
MGDRPPTPLELVQKHAHMFMETVPWANALGFELVKVERARAIARVAWREDLVGDAETGVMAGGVITSILDNICGVAISAALDTFKSMATLDLRIDYMRPGEKGRDIIAEAECYHVTRSVAFTRAWAYHETRDRIVASASGAFALNDPNRWASGGAMAIVKDVLDGRT